MSKKILLTGTQGADCNAFNWQSGRSKYALIWSWTSIYNCLEDMGYEIDNRPVVPGESLDEYEHVIVGVFDITNGLQAQAYGALWALYKRKDAIINITDWKTPSIIARYNSINREMHGENLFRDFMYDRTKHSDLVKDDPTMQQCIIDGIKSMHEHKFMFSTFNRPNFDLIPDCPPMVQAFNPEPYNVEPMSRVPATLGIFGKPKKKRQWVITGIAAGPIKKTGKELQRFKSDVILLGNPKHIEGAKKVKEPDVIQSYIDSTMCYYPDQGNFGSNWWRNRPRQCADAECVLVIENDEEAKLFGPSYVGLTVESVEAMSDEELANLAQRQREDYYKSNPLDKSFQQSQFKLILE